jgi:hypothetical protein
MMPSRPVIIAIVAFWLLTAGWFVVRDVGPSWRAGDPPPFTIELSDEAMRSVAPDRWTYTLNGHKSGTITTALVYEQADDTFELRAKCPEIKFLEGVVIQGYDDGVRVTREGELRGMRTAATVAVTGIGQRIQAKAELSAEVRGGQLERRLVLDAPGFGRFAPQLESTDPPRGSVLNPMHPVPRVTGLRPGQTWRQPLFDPRHDILKAAYDQSGFAKFFPLPSMPTTLNAQVLSAPQSLDWNGPHLCLVIEYRGDDDYVARTWVRMSDGAVLRQEAGGHGDMVVLQRE